MMQPTFHISIAVVYESLSSMSSGARYHLVTTCVLSWRLHGGERRGATGGGGGEGGDEWGREGGG